MSQKRQAGRRRLAAPLIPCVVNTVQVPKNFVPDIPKMETWCRSGTSRMQFGGRIARPDRAGHGNVLAAHACIPWIHRFDARVPGPDLRSVSSDSNLPADLELKGDLSAFQMEYQSGMPSVNIRFYATLVQSTRNRTVATRSFEVRQPAEGRNVPDVVTRSEKPPTCSPRR